MSERKDFENFEMQEIINKHQQIMFLMIDAKHTDLSKDIIQHLTELHHPIKKSQDDIIKQLLESNMSLTLKNTDCDESLMKYKGRIRNNP